MMNESACAIKLQCASINIASGLFFDFLHSVNGIGVSQHLNLQNLKNLLNLIKVKYWFTSTDFEQ